MHSKRPLMILAGSLLFLSWSCKSSEKAKGNQSNNEAVAATENEKIKPGWAPNTSHPYRPSETKIHDLIHTRLEVSFDWEKSWMYGIANLKLKPWFQAASVLKLDAKGFEIREIWMNAGSGKKPLQYKYDGLILEIDLGTTYSRKDTFEIGISYIAKPNDLKIEGSAAITDAKGLYFINPKGEETDKPRQIWTQGETESSSCWFPTIDKPNERTSQEIFITVDSSFVTLSNGILARSTKNDDGTRTDYWKMDLPHAPYLFMMAIGEFSVTKETWRGKEVSYYVEPEFGPHAKAIFGATPEMLEFFSNILGVEYPWAKYSQVSVRDYVSGAMENTSATIHGAFIQETTRELIDGNNEGVISHELFHHWFGDLVTCESWSNLPLNESFATYGEFLWNEYKYGSDAAAMGLAGNLGAYLSESQGKREYLIRYHYGNREDMFDTHSYQKGSRILHMLRKYTGDDAFFASLKKYLQDNAYSDAEVHDLRLAFEDVTGQDLNWFFNQWFLSPGHPELKISYRFDENTSEVVLSAQQIQDLDYMPLYKLPCQVEIFSAGNRKNHDFIFETESAEFRFPCAVKPDYVSFDPEKTLLARIDEKKSDEEWLKQMKNAGNFLQVRESLDRLAFDHADSAVFETMLGLLKHPFWAGRSSVLEKFSLYSGDRLPELVKIASEMALSDPKPQVRRAAIDFLANTNPPASSGEGSAAIDKESVLGVFKAAAKDSSISVLSRALDAYNDWEPGGAVTFAEQLEKEESESVRTTVAKIYMEANHPRAFDYVSDLLTGMGDGFGKFGLITTFAGWLDSQSEPVQAKGIETLKTLAESAGSWWVRMPAIRCLIDRIEKEGVRDFLKAMKEKESNPSLKKMLEDVVGSE